MKSNLSYVGRFAAAIRSPFRPPRDQLDRLDYFSGLGDSAYLLFGLARALKPQTVVEIGSARGKSACFLGMALKENGSGKLYAIDPHAPTAWNDLESTDTIEEMRRNISALGLEEIVEIVRMTSGAETTASRASRATGIHSLPTSSNSGWSCFTTRCGTASRTSDFNGPIWEYPHLSSH